jgi:hypothetical protein
MRSRILRADATRTAFHRLKPLASLAKLRKLNALPNWKMSNTLSDPAKRAWWYTAKLEPKLAKLLMLSDDASSSCAPKRVVDPTASSVANVVPASARQLPRRAKARMLRELPRKRASITLRQLPTRSGALKLNAEPSTRKSKTLTEHAKRDAENTASPLAREEKARKLSALAKLTKSSTANDDATRTLLKVAIELPRRLTLRRARLEPKTARSNRLTPMAPVRVAATLRAEPQRNMDRRLNALPRCR